MKASKVRSGLRTLLCSKMLVLTMFTLMFVTIGMPQAASAAPTPITACPTVISFPGSYRLDVDCMLGPSAAYAIAINASNVSLNLNDHVLSGPFAVADDCAGTMQAIGIEVNGTHVTINNGVVIRFLAGIRLFLGQDHQVSNLTATGNCDGVVLFQSHSNVINGNNLSGNYLRAVTFVAANDNRVSNNLASNNGTQTLGGNHGIFLENSNNNTINGNEVNANRNARGIRLLTSNNNVIRNNKIIGNSGEGIRIDQDGSNGNLIQANTAIANNPDLVDANISTCINTWTNNTFHTDNEGNGPGAGCVR